MKGMSEDSPLCAHDDRSADARQFSKAAINFGNVLPAVIGGMRAVTSEQAMCACVP
jgi:hypothetical protein